MRYEHYDIDADLSAKLKKYGTLSNNIALAINKRNAIGKQIDILKNLKGLTNKTQKEVEEQTTVAVTL